MKRRSRLLVGAMAPPFLFGVLTFTAGPAVALTAPTIYGVSPQSGPTAGGTPVRITGNHFIGTTAVTFDSVAATKWHVVDDFLITAVTPPAAHPSNTLVSVAITANGFAPASMANAFDYTNATLTLTLSANSGLADHQAVTVAVNGCQPNTQVIIHRAQPPGPVDRAVRPLPVDAAGPALRRSSVHGPYRRQRQREPIRERAQGHVLHRRVERLGL